MYGIFCLIIGAPALIALWGFDFISNKIGNQRYVAWAKQQSESHEKWIRDATGGDEESDNRFQANFDVEALVEECGLFGLEAEIVFMKCQASKLIPLARKGLIPRHAATHGIMTPSKLTEEEFGYCLTFFKYLNKTLLENGFKYEAIVSEYILNANLGGVYWLKNYNPKLTKDKVVIITWEPHYSYQQKGRKYVIH